MRNTIRETPLEADIARKHLPRATPIKAAASTPESGEHQPIIESGDRLGYRRIQAVGGQEADGLSGYGLGLNGAAQMLQRPLRREPQRQAGARRSSSHEF